MADALNDSWSVAGRTFTSRLIVGTGKYKDFAENAAAVEASGAEHELPRQPAGGPGFQHLAAAGAARRFAGADEVLDLASVPRAEAAPGARRISVQGPISVHGARG